MKTKEEKIIIDIRNYLYEPVTIHLHEDALKTTDMNELKDLVKRAKRLHETYVEDAEYYLNFIEEK